MKQDVDVLHTSQQVDLLLVKRIEMRPLHCLISSHLPVLQHFISAYLNRFQLNYIIARYTFRLMQNLVLSKATNPDEVDSSKTKNL